MVLTCLDAASSQTVTVLHIYLPRDVRFRERFADMFSREVVDHSWDKLGWTGKLARWWWAVRQRWFHRRPLEWPKGKAGSLVLNFQKLHETVPAKCVEADRTNPQREVWAPVSAAEEKRD